MHGISILYQNRVCLCIICNLEVKYCFFHLNTMFQTQLCMMKGRDIEVSALCFMNTAMAPCLCISVMPCQWTSGGNV